MERLGKLVSVHGTPGADPAFCVVSRFMAAHRAEQDDSAVLLVSYAFGVLALTSALPFAAGVMLLAALASCLLVAPARFWGGGGGAREAVLPHFVRSLFLFLMVI